MFCLFKLITTLVYYSTFQLLLVAYDTGEPLYSATATVTVNVNHNLNRPRFDRATYRVTVNQKETYGKMVLNTTATDDDMVSLYQLIFIYDRYWS